MADTAETFTNKGAPEESSGGGFMGMVRSLFSGGSKAEEQAAPQKAMMARSAPREMAAPETLGLRAQASFRPGAGTDHNGQYSHAILVE